MAASSSEGHTGFGPAAPCHSKSAFIGLSATAWSSSSESHDEAGAPSPGRERVLQQGSASSAVHANTSPAGLLCPGGQPRPHQPANSNLLGEPGSSSDIPSAHGSNGFATAGGRLPSRKDCRSRAAPSELDASDSGSDSQDVQAGSRSRAASSCTAPAEQLVQLQADSDTSQGGPPADEAVARNLPGYPEQHGHLSGTEHDRSKAGKDAEEEGGSMQAAAVPESPTVQHTQPGTVQAENHQQLPPQLPHESAPDVLQGHDVKAEGGSKQAEAAPVRPSEAKPLAPAVANHAGNVDSSPCMGQKGATRQGQPAGLSSPLRPGQLDCKHLDASVHAGQAHQHLASAYPESAGKSFPTRDRPESAQIQQSLLPPSHHGIPFAGEGLNPSMPRSDSTAEIWAIPAIVSSFCSTSLHGTFSTPAKVPFSAKLDIQQGLPGTLPPEPAAQKYMAVPAEKAASLEPAPLEHSSPQQEQSSDSSMLLHLGTAPHHIQAYLKGCLPRLTSRRLSLAPSILEKHVPLLEPDMAMAGSASAPISPVAGGRNQGVEGAAAKTGHVRSGSWSDSLSCHTHGAHSNATGALEPAAVKGEGGLPQPHSHQQPAQPLGALGSERDQLPAAPDVLDPPSGTAIAGHAQRAYVSAASREVLAALKNGSLELPSEPGVSSAQGAPLLPEVSPQATLSPAQDHAAHEDHGCAAEQSGMQGLGWGTVLIPPCQQASGGSGHVLQCPSLNPPQQADGKALHLADQPGGVTEADAQAAEQVVQRRARASSLQLILPRKSSLLMQPQVLRTEPEGAAVGFEL